MADKGGFPHHMLKEIFDQPQRAARHDRASGFARRSCHPAGRRAHHRGRTVFPAADQHCGLGNQPSRWHGRPVHDSGSGEHARGCGLCQRVRISQPANWPNELTIVITQSGETADTTAAQREAKARGSRTIAISNVMDSTIAREADGVLYTHAGRRSASHQLKHSRRRWRCCFCSQSILARCAGSLTKEQGAAYPRTA